MSLRGVKSVRARLPPRRSTRRVRAPPVVAATRAPTADSNSASEIETRPEKEPPPTLTLQPKGRCGDPTRTRQPLDAEGLDVALSRCVLEENRSESPKTKESKTPEVGQKLEYSSSFETLRTSIKDYEPSRVYLTHVSNVDWKALPGRRSNGERVWVVGAADQEGRHRTRLLVAGRHWRPRCLRRVNMVTQPVVYAGGGRGSLTPDLFLWWFHHEFATAATAMHPDGAVLVAERADYLPPESDCVTVDGLVRLIVVPQDCLEPGLVVNELRVRLAAGIMSNGLADIRRGAGEPGLHGHVKNFSLKEAFVGLHRAWLNIRPETFARSWSTIGGNDPDAVRGPPGPQPWLSPRSHYLAEHNEDRMLLEELQGLGRDVGIEAKPQDIAEWLADDSVFERCVKKEVEDDENVNENGDGRDEEFEEHNSKEQDGEQDSCSPEEATKLLSRVLTWMESEPFDPGLLLAVRSIRDTAVLVVSTGLIRAKPLQASTTLGSLDSLRYQRVRCGRRSFD